MDVRSQFGRILRDLRNARSLAQEELAHRAGMDVTYLSDLERGRWNPSLAMFANPTAIQAVADAACKAPIATDQLTKYDAALGVYELQVRPQLLSSRLAPLILSLGEGLPVVGRHVDFPTK